MGFFFYVCDSIFIYVFVMDDIGDIQVYELDVEDYSLFFYCIFDVFVMGVVFFIECILLFCSMFYIDLDFDDSFGVFGLGYQCMICIGLVLVADVDVEVFLFFVLDLICLQVLSLFDGGVE